MRVRMKVGMSGTRGGVDWPPLGGELEVSDEEGAQLIAGGLAEAVATTPADKAAASEKAVAPDAEQRGGGLTTENAPTRGRMSRAKQ